MAETRRITIEVDAETVKRLKIFSAKNSITISNILRGLIDNFLNDSASAPMATTKQSTEVSDVEKEVDITKLKNYMKGLIKS